MKNPNPKKGFSVSEIKKLNKLSSFIAIFSAIGVPLLMEYIA